MITLLEKLPENAQLWQTLESICPAEAAVIWAEAPLLGFGNAALWQQQTRDETTALLLRNTMGGVTLAALPQANAAELAEFLQVIGFTSLTLPLQWAERLAVPNTTAESYLVLKWNEQAAALPYGLAPREITAGQLLQNTAAAFEQNVTPEEQQEWQWAFGLRQRRGTATAWGLWQRDKMLSAAALSHVGRSAAIIGFVGTLPQHRGKGYGKIIASVMAAKAVEKGYSPLLCCKPELEKMYRAAGFVPVYKQGVVGPLNDT